MEMITTDECESCKHGAVIEEDKAHIKVYCAIKDKYYYFGQCIPCENKTIIKEENNGYTESV